MEPLNFVKRNYKFPLVKVTYEDEIGKKHQKVMRDVTDLISNSEEIKADHTYDRNSMNVPVEMV